MNPTPAEDLARRVSAASHYRVGYRATERSRSVVVYLGQAAWIDFKWPVRAPAAYKGQWSKPGFYYMTSIDEMVTYESRYEMSHLAYADQRQCVVSVCPQPFRLHWREGNSRRSHVPDFFFRNRDGSTEVLDVKGSRFAHDPENAYVFGVTARACKLMGHGYRVAHDLPKPVRDNLDWIAAARIRPHLADDLVASVWSGAGDGIPLGDLVSLVAKQHGVLPVQVRGVVFHLMWCGDLGFDWREPLSARSIVSRI